LLTSPPILRITDPNEYLIVCIDTCKEGLGGVLSQNGFVIYYESMKLKEHEKKYATHELELAAIVHALKKWRHYLMGRRFELRIDHKNLKYLFDQPTLNTRQSRWLEFLWSTTLRSSISKERRIKWLMHSTGGCMNYRLQPFACIRLILKVELWRLQM
jgi:ribonuclease HI